MSSFVGFDRDLGYAEVVLELPFEYPLELVEATVSAPPGVSVAMGTHGEMVERSYRFGAEAARYSDATDVSGQLHVPLRFELSHDIPEGTPIPIRIDIDREYESSTYAYAYLLVERGTLIAIDSAEYLDRVTDAQDGYALVTESWPTREPDVYAFDARTAMRGTVDDGTTVDPVEVLRALNVPDELEARFLADYSANEREALVVGFDEPMQRSAGATHQVLAQITYWHSFAAEWGSLATGGMIRACNPYDTTCGAENGDCCFDGPERLQIELQGRASSSHSWSSGGTTYTNFGWFYFSYPSDWTQLRARIVFERDANPDTFRIVSEGGSTYVLYANITPSGTATIVSNMRLTPPSDSSGFIGGLLTAWDGVERTERVARESLGGYGHLVEPVYARVYADQDCPVGAIACAGCSQIASAWYQTMILQASTLRSPDTIAHEWGHTAHALSVFDAGLAAGPGLSCDVGYQYPRNGETAGHPLAGHQIGSESHLLEPVAYLYEIMSFFDPAEADWTLQSEYICRLFPDAHGFAQGCSEHFPYQGWHALRCPLVQCDLPPQSCAVVSDEMNDIAAPLNTLHGLLQLVDGHEGDVDYGSSDVAQVSLDELYEAAADWYNTTGAAGNNRTRQEGVYDEIETVGGVQRTCSLTSVVDDCCPTSAPCGDTDEVACLGGLCFEGDPHGENLRDWIHHLAAVSSETEAQLWGAMRGSYCIGGSDTNYSGGFTGGYRAD